MTSKDKYHGPPEIDGPWILTVLVGFFVFSLLCYGCNKIVDANIKQSIKNVDKNITDCG